MVETVLEADFYEDGVIEESFERGDEKDFLMKVLDEIEEFDDKTELEEFYEDAGLKDPDFGKFQEYMYYEWEKYWVNKPYSYISILHIEEKNSFVYIVNEPVLTEEEKTVKEDLSKRLRSTLMYEDIDSDSTNKREILEEKVDEIIENYGLEIDRNSKLKILYYLKRDFIDYNKIDPIMKDPYIEDISCNGNFRPLFVYHEEMENMMTNVMFSQEQLSSFVKKLAQKSGKHVSVSNPLVDAHAPDGSRIQLTKDYEVTAKGSTFTIRKFNEEPITPTELVGKYNTFSLEQMAYLWLCIQEGRSLIFAGGTASGKTTSMNAVSLFIPPSAKIISIEDTREVELPHINWIPSETRDSFGGEEDNDVDMYDLLRAGLRQRPEYIIVGEVRGAEAVTLFQAMSTGHTTYSTMHADSVESALDRLQNPPISVPRSLIKSLDIMSVQAQAYIQDEKERRTKEIQEIKGIDTKNRKLKTDKIYEWDADADRFQKVGESKALKDIKTRRGWDDKELRKELEKRQDVLEYMIDKEIYDYSSAAKVIQAFMNNPDQIHNKIIDDEKDLDLDRLEMVDLKEGEVEAKEY